jgi:hypothetical protein
MHHPATRTATDCETACKLFTPPMAMTEATAGMAGARQTFFSHSLESRC